MDDIEFGGTSEKLYKDFENLMKSEFEMSFMGKLTYFLGLQVKQTKEGIFFYQAKYLREIQDISVD